MPGNLPNSVQLGDLETWWIVDRLSAAFNAISDAFTLSCRNFYEENLTFFNTIANSSNNIPSMKFHCCRLHNGQKSTTLIVSLDKTQRSITWHTHSTILLKVFIFKYLFNACD